MRIAAPLILAAGFATAALAQDPQAPKAPEAPATLEITWPPQGAEITLGQDPLRSIGVVVRSNYRLMPSGQCGGDARCGHLHMKIDPEGDTCNRPGKPLFGRANSMNSDFGGPLIQAHFGACPTPTGEHVIGVLLADDRHQPVLVDGKPVTALVQVHTR